MIVRTLCEASIKQSIEPRDLLHSKIKKLHGNIMEQGRGGGGAGVGVGVGVVVEGAQLNCLPIDKVDATK